MQKKNPTIEDLQQRIIELETELNAKKKNIFSAIDEIDDPVFLINADFGIRDLNKKASVLWNMDKETVIGQKCHQILFKLKVPSEKCPLAKSLRSKKNESIEYYDSIRQKWFLLNSTPLFNEKNEIDSCIDILHDITDFKSIQIRTERITKSLQKAEKIAKIGNWEFDLGLQIVRASKGAREIYGLGIKQEKLTINQAKNIPLKEYRTKMDKALEDLIINNIPYDVEFEIIRETDKQRRYIHSIAEYDKERNIVFGIIRDITEEKETELALKKQNSEIEILNEELLAQNEELKRAKFETEQNAKILSRTEKRYRRLFENMHSGVAIYRAIDNGKDFKFLDFNRTAEQITKLTKEKAIGSTLLSQFPNMKNSPLFEALKEVDKTGKDKFLPPFYYKDKKREGWRQNYIYKLSTGEIIAIFTDVTELKRKEIELQKHNEELENAKVEALESEARYKALHNASFGGIGIHDNGIILDCNKGLVDITGYSFEELIGMDGFLLIEENYRDVVIDSINKKNEKYYEVIGVKKDGTKYPLRIEARVIPYKGKTVRVAEFRDITEQKKYEKELIRLSQLAQENEQYFRSIFEQAPILYWEENFSEIKKELNILKQNTENLEKYFDENPEIILEFAKKTKIENVNDTVFKTLGFKTKEDFFENLPFLFTEKSILDFKAALVNMAEDKTIFKCLTEQKTADGTVKHFLMKSFVPKGFENDFSKVIVAMVDISEIIEYEKKLIDAKEKAEESDKLKVAFLNNISHEFRTPMNGILGFSDLLITSEEDPATKQLYAQIINESCERLLDIVTDTIEISQIQSNQIAIDYNEFGIKSIIKSVLDAEKPKISKKGLEFIYSNDLDEDVLVKLDFQKTFRAVKHLIDNALKFTSKGTIELNVKRNTKNVCITVSDTGIGISKNMQTKIFEPFRQVELGATRNYGGNGVGLSLVKSYIELMGGTIELESKTNVGTKVTISLPIYHKNKNTNS